MPAVENGKKKEREKIRKIEGANPRRTLPSDDGGNVGEGFEIILAAFKQSQPGRVGEVGGGGG